MTLRVRIALAAALAVALAIVVAAAATYVTVERSLLQQTDATLTQIASEISQTPVQSLAALRPEAARPDAPPTGRGRVARPAGADARLAGGGAIVQVLTAAGDIRVTLAPGGIFEREPTPLPVTDTARNVLDGRSAAAETVIVDGESVRLLTQSIRTGGAVQVALPIDDAVQSLGVVRRRLAAGVVLAVALAALMGFAISRRTLRPLRELSRMAKDVAVTQDLSRRLASDLSDPTGDELAQLGATLNTMLSRLEASQDAQQQLIADASHELRTPLTSLRTNIEVLDRIDALSPEDRTALVGDVNGQLVEFSRLVDALVELARGELPATAARSCQLDEIVATAVDRARTFHPHVDLTVNSQPTTVIAESERIERAVTNLIDNAIKYGREPIEVHVGDAGVVVRDHGDGVPPAELDKIFERFHRADAARSADGSGLGLAIVKQVARSHGGDVTVRNHPDGGAEFTLAIST